MLKKIFRSSFVTSLFVLFVSFILIVGVLFEYFEAQTFKELRSEADYIGYALEKEDISYLEYFDNDNKRITLVAADGTVIADTRAEAEELSNHSNRQEIKEALEEGTGESVRYSNTLMKKTLYYAKQMDDGRILRVSTTQNSVILILIGLLQPLLIVVLIALFLSFFISKKVSRGIVEPINNLNLEEPANNEVYDELAPLLRKIAMQKKTIDRQLQEAREKQEEIRQIAQQREQMRQEFTSNVSHELKTPLTSISGFAEMLKTGGVEENTVIDFSESIYEEAQRLITLVSDIIKISELDEGSTLYEEEKVDLAEVSREVVRRLAPAAEKRGVHLQVTGEHVCVNGVGKILEEIIYNLCDNGIKYNKEEGNVDIILKTMEDTVSLIVRDTGIGIPLPDQNRVFERFYRVDKSHSKQVGGTGLGLAIVKHGVAFHGGSISLESEEGKGTAIKVEFPKCCK